MPTAPMRLVESRLPARLLREAGRDDAVGLAEIVLQVVVRKPRLRIVLDPRHAARGQIGPRSRTRLIRQDLTRKLAPLVGMARFAFAPATHDDEDAPRERPQVRRHVFFDSLVVQAVPTSAFSHSQDPKPSFRQTRGAHQIMNPLAILGRLDQLEEIPVL